MKCRRRSRKTASFAAKAAHSDGAGMAGGLGFGSEGGGGGGSSRLFGGRHAVESAAGAAASAAAMNRRREIRRTGAREVKVLIPCSLELLFVTAPGIWSSEVQFQPE